MTTRCPATTTDMGQPTRCRLPEGHPGHHDDGAILWGEGPLSPPEPDLRAEVARLAAELAAEVERCRYWYHQAQQLKAELARVTGERDALQRDHETRRRLAAERAVERDQARTDLAAEREAHAATRADRDTLARLAGLATQLAVQIWEAQHINLNAIETWAHKSLTRAHALGAAQEEERAAVQMRAVLRLPPDTTPRRAWYLVCQRLDEGAQAAGEVERLRARLAEAEGELARVREGRG